MKGLLTTGQQAILFLSTSDALGPSELNAKEKKTEMKYEWIIFGIVVMGTITGTLILTPSLVKAQSIPTGTYETDSKLQVRNMSAFYCDYCLPFKSGFDMLGIIRNTGNTFMIKLVYLPNYLMTEGDLLHWKIYPVQHRLTPMIRYLLEYLCLMLTKLH